MGLQAVPAYIGEALFQNPVENDRNVLKSLFRRTGLVKPGDLHVTPTGTARQVSVSSGAAFLLGTETSTQGGYHVWSDGADLFTFAAAVGNPRIDTLVLRAIDEQYGSDPGISRAELEIVQGVAGASPSPRADSYFNTGGGAYKPGAWYRLADVRVNVVDGVLPAGQITETLQYVIRNGRTICTSTTRPASPLYGDRIDETDTGLNYRYNGSAWVMSEPYRVRTTLGAAAASVTFSNIPAAIRSVRLFVLARGDTAAAFTSVRIRLNGDSATNYDDEQITASGSTVGAFEAINDSGGMQIGELAAASALTGSSSGYRIDIPGMQAPFWKAIICSHHLSSQTSGGQSGAVFSKQWAGRWRNTAAVTSITLVPSAGNFVTGSEFLLEGWD